MDETRRSINVSPPKRSIVAVKEATIDLLFAKRETLSLAIRLSVLKQISSMRSREDETTGQIFAAFHAAGAESE